MTRKGYGINKRFPYFGIFLVIAIAVAIPLTVWSFGHAPTNYEQQAQTQKCGPNNQNPSCPADYTCSYASNDPNLGGTCILTSLNAPQNPKSSSSCKINADKPNDAIFSLSWEGVNNATSYKIYGNYYYLNQTKLVNVMVGPYYASTNFYALSIPLPHDVQFFYWNVKAYNSLYKVTGPSGASSSIVIKCQ